LEIVEAFKEGFMSSPVGMIGSHIDE
jgi:hypothetical protein